MKFQAWNVIKKKLQHKCFLVNIEKILRTVFYRTPQAAVYVYKENDMVNIKK